jgi:two-component system, NtrC family, sensor kinase
LKNEVIAHEQEKQLLLASQNETLEKQVTERTAELHQSLETLKSTQNQLIQSEKLASLGELTAGIAHEIQNPLNFVNNFSELSVDLVKELKEEIEKPTKKKSIIMANGQVAL